MSGRERFVLTFAAAYAVAYYVAVYYNLGPAVGEWTLFNRPASAIIAAPVGLLACMLPQRTASRLWPALAWLAPLCSIAAIAYLLRGYVTQ